MGDKQAAEAEIKVMSGGTSTSDNDDLAKEFKFTVNNAQTAEQSSVKRQVVQKLVKLARQQQLSKGQETEAWQRHRFILDDGKSSMVASKSTESMLTLQLNAQRHDLNKM